MPFLLVEILNFQGTAHLIGVGSLSILLFKEEKLMSLRKKCLAVGMSMALMVMSSMPVLATYTCDVCGVGTVAVVRSSVNDWSFIGTTPCTKVKDAKDDVYIKVYSYHEECNNCPAAYDYTINKYDVRCSH